MKDDVKITLNTDLLDSGYKPPNIDAPKVDNEGLDKLKIVGKITREIGTGDDAKHSIIWTTIRWCFIIATVITIILFIFLAIAFTTNNASEISELKRFIITIWSIFTPIITLALGYAFGKDYK